MRDREGEKKEKEKVGDRGGGEMYHYKLKNVRDRGGTVGRVNAS